MRLCPDCERGVAAYQMKSTTSDWWLGATFPNIYSGNLLTRKAICRTCGGTGMIEDGLVMRQAEAIARLIGECTRLYAIIADLRRALDAQTTAD